MKKLVFVLVLLLALLVQPALAVNDTAQADHIIEVMGGEIAFTTPEGFLCLTRETSASVFNRWGMSQREMMAYMEEYGIYALIYDLEAGPVYEVSITDTDSLDYDNANEIDLQMISAGTHKWLREQGYEVPMSDTYRSARHVYGMAETSYIYDDGYVEQRLLLYTCQNGYEVAVSLWPPEEQSAEMYRDDAKAFVDTLIITRKALPVTTEETPEGQFILRLSDIKLTFTPMDVRYCLTRESSRYLFDRLGYDVQQTLDYMERTGNYAILYDARRTVETNVFLLDSYGTQPYEDMTDWLVLAVEKKQIKDGGWTIKSCSLLEDSSMRFVRSLLCRTEEDGTTSWRLVYGCNLENLRLDISVIAHGEKTLEAVQAETDAFVRTTIYEETKD